MLSGFEVFFIMFFIVIIVGLAVWFFIMKSRMKVEESDGDLIWNLASNKCNKRSTGVELDIISGRRGRELITYEPKDGDESEIRVIVDKKLESIRGGISKEKGIKILLPRNAEDLPKSIKSTDLGKVLSSYIENKTLEFNVISALREGKNRREAMRLLLGDGELSKDQVARLNEIFNEMMDTLKNSGKGKE